MVSNGNRKSRVFRLLFLIPHALLQRQNCAIFHEKLIFGGIQTKGHVIALSLV